MRKFKDFLNFTNVALIIFGLVMAVAIYVYAVVFVKDQHLQDYFINIAASCFAIIPTVVAVNYFSDLRWESARDTTKSELRTLVDQHLREVVMPWGYMPGAGEADQMTQSLTDTHRRHYFKVVAAKLLENDTRDDVHGFGPNEWKLLRENTDRILPLVARFLELHARTITPEDHGNLLALQSKLEKLTYALRLEDGALTTLYNAWEARHHFATPEYAHAARSQVQKQVAGAFYEYLEALARLKS